MEHLMIYKIIYKLIGMAGKNLEGRIPYLPTYLSTKLKGIVSLFYGFFNNHPEIYWFVHKYVQSTIIIDYAKKLIQIRYDWSLGKLFYHNGIAIQNIYFHITCNLQMFQRLERSIICINTQLKSDIFTCWSMVLFE